jgi:Transposase
VQTVSTIGLDIAKSVFQVHGVDANGSVVIRRQLKRRYVLAFFEKLPRCLVGMEACASSHHWSRELQALGHTVRLMPPAYVKPYVKRQKNDMADAEAICEAVTRANMRFVPTKTPEQQSGLMLHRTRHLFIRQQTSVINAIRAHLAEFGVTAPVGRKGMEELLHVIADPSDKRVPDVVRACLAALGRQLLTLKKQILDFDRMIMATASIKRASASIAFQALVRCSPPRLSRTSPILKPSARVATSRPGSDWYPNSTRAGVGTGSAVSANRETAICAACSWPAHSPSSAMPRSMAPSIGPGSQRCWHGGQPKSLPSRLPTSSREWPGQ